MHVLDDSDEVGTLTLVCPLCGWKEKQYGRTVADKKADKANVSIGKAQEAPPPDEGRSIEPIRSKTNVRDCPKCGKQYAIKCPACPYCDWVPLIEGRKQWMRWPIIVVGVSCSLVAGFLAFRLLGEADDEFWPAIVGGAGIIMTLKIANALVGGGKDTEV